MSKCMLLPPPPERGIAAMLTRRAEDCWVSKGQKKKKTILNYTYENTLTTGEVKQRQNRPCSTATSAASWRGSRLEKRGDCHFSEMLNYD